MTAKEMFEKLGFFPSYDYKTNEKEIAFYDKEKGIDKMIVFYLKKKTIWVSFGYDEITLKELQAINKQVEELGWNNETTI